jgi:hypothetical protein
MAPIGAVQQLCGSAPFFARVHLASCKILASASIKFSSASRAITRPSADCRAVTVLRRTAAGAPDHAWAAHGSWAATADIVIPGSSRPRRDGSRQPWTTP